MGKREWVHIKRKEDTPVMSEDVTRRIATPSGASHEVRPSDAPQPSMEPQTQDQSGFAANAHGAEPDDDSNPDITKEEAEAYVKLLADADPKSLEDFERKVCSVSGKTIKGLIRIVHPDKWAGNVLLVEQANRASKNLNTWRDLAGDNKIVNFIFGNEPSEDEIKEPSPTQRTAQDKATPYLEAIFKAMMKNPNLTPLSKNADEETKSAVAAVASINAEIVAENKEGDKTGEILLYELSGKWRPLLSMPDQRTIFQDNCNKLCDKYHYPKKWAMQHILGSNVREGQSQQPPAPQNASHFEQQQSQAQPGGPHYGGSHGLAGQAGQPGPNQVTLWNYHAGRTRSIRLAQRTTTYEINPGFTSEGERILAIQYMGKLVANFLVEDAERNVRLITSSEGGGKTALDAAEGIKVPKFEQDPSAILDIKKRVNKGGKFGLDCVGIGEMPNDPKAKDPYCAVRFYHNHPKDGHKDWYLSKTALCKIFGSVQGELMIASSNATNTTNTTNSSNTTNTTNTNSSNTSTNNSGNPRWGWNFEV
ncbi:hypothetical protein N7540_012505 [Penicillium herquei]|nr:hypothetical protein N7540_012505 [Penicillium herquei]